MSFFPLFIASVDGPDSSGSIMIVGFLLVIVVLALLAIITASIGAFFANQAARAAARTANAKASAPIAAATAAGEEADPDNDPLLTCVIAAAIHSVIGDRPHRVVSIHSSSEGWAQEGRRQIFSSHRIR